MGDRDVARGNFQWLRTFTSRPDVYCAGSAAFNYLLHDRYLTKQHRPTVCSVRAPAREAGALPRAPGFLPTTPSKSITMGFLTPMATEFLFSPWICRRVICSFRLASKNSHLEDALAHCFDCAVSFRQGADDPRPCRLLCLEN